MIERTPVAILGTLAEFHREPIPYDLRALVVLVRQVNPDLLCLDMTTEQWQNQEFGDLPPEYREALLPLAHQTDIVIAPIGGERPLSEPTAPGWRGNCITLIRHWLAQLHRAAPSPTAVNSGPRHFLADSFYTLINWLAGHHAHLKQHHHTAALTRHILEVAHHDPGRRILVVVNVRYCHHIRQLLSKHTEIYLIPFSQL